MTTQRPKTEILQEAFQNLDAWRKLVLHSRQTAMQLFIHPQTTANDVMRIQKSLVQQQECYRQAFDQIMKVSKNGGLLPPRYDMGRLRPP